MKEQTNTMRCSINLQSDPISLNIIATNGKVHQLLDNIGNGGFVEVIVVEPQAKFQVGQGVIYLSADSKPLAATVTAAEYDPFEPEEDNRYPDPPMWYYQTDGTGETWIPEDGLEARNPHSTVRSRYQGGGER